MTTSTQTDQPTGHIASFLRKHNRLLTSIGAVIVVLTFVAREGVQDYLKNQLDSIEFARNAYVARADTKSVLDVVGGLYINLTDLTTELTSHPPGFKKGDLDGIVVSQFNFYKDQLDGIQRVMETARALFQALPGSEAELIETSRIDEQIKEQRQEMDSEESDLQLDAEVESHTLGKLSPETEKKLGESTYKFALANLGLWKSIGEVATKAFSMASAEEEKYRKWYHWSTIGSWFLYALGVTLSLLTAIYSKSDDPAHAPIKGE